MYPKAIYNRISSPQGNRTRLVDSEARNMNAAGLWVRYTYNTSRPHAASGITQVDPGYSPPAHELTFTPFNKIKDIEADNEPLGHTYRQAFTYDPQRYSFDAWGRRRNPTDWSQKASGNGYITNRGFTGHVREAQMHILKHIRYEMRHGDGIIDMNEIFDNFNRVHDGTHMGWQSRMKINFKSGKSFIARLDFKYGLNGMFQPIDFGGGSTYMRPMKAPLYPGKFWHIYHQPTVWEIGALTSDPLDWDNWKFLLDWLGK